MGDFCTTWNPDSTWCPASEQDRDLKLLEKGSKAWSLPVEAKETKVLVLESEQSLEERFREQAEKWARETEHLSSPTQMMLHPSYQAILGMAREDEQEVIRLMLRDLRDNRREWFWALSYLTQDNPINPRDAGKMDKMIDAWVKWGKGRRLL